MASPSDVSARHPLAGAAVLVCGASGGIGSALARECAARRARLTLVGRDRGRLQAVGVPADLVALDLRDADAPARAVAAASDASEGLDVVIDAVGAVAFGAVDAVPDDVLRALFDLNALLPIRLAAAALPALREGGAFVTISGVIAERNLPGMTAYGAAKAASRAFTEGLAREARRRRVRALDARPPHTDTGLATRALVGSAPALGAGLDPAHVARVICDGLESGARELPSEAFAVGS